MHDIVLAFGPTAEQAGKLAAKHLSPARAFATPEHYCASGWLNSRPYSPQKYGPYEKVVERWFARVVKGCPLRGEMHFGDTSLWELPPWKHIGYGMVQDLGHPFAVGFMRTGQRSSFGFLNAFARHVPLDNTVREMLHQGRITSCLPWSASASGGSRKAQRWQRACLMAWGSRLPAAGRWTHPPCR